MRPFVLPLSMLALLLAAPVFLLAVPVFLLAVPAGAAEQHADQQKLERTVPGHFDALPTDPWPLQPLIPFRAVPERPERVVYKLNGRVRDLAVLDRDLSAACRRGAFMQRLDAIFRVRSADDRPFGIGWGSGVNLHDPEKRSALDKVYLFDRQDTGRCAVWVAPLADFRRLLLPRATR